MPSWHGTLLKKSTGATLPLHNENEAKKKNQKMHANSIQLTGMF